MNPRDVRYVAYTGKAANVLKNKGCPGATTVHKLLYYATQMPNGKFYYKPKQILDDDPKVIVVDEVSMLKKDLWNRLCSYKGIYILACGDPAQLPPIPDHKGEDIDNHLLDHPHVFLDEIMRQAAESEIIRLSLHVREGKPLETFDYSNQDVQVYNRNELNSGMMHWADQILCATKSNRAALNNWMRQSNGYGASPQIGDRVINLENNWNILSNYDNPLTNGIIGTITDIKEKTIKFPGFIRKKRRSFEVPVFCGTITGDDNNEFFTDLIWDKKEMVTGISELSSSEEYLIKKLKSDLYTLPLHFDYGYAITVWKAQGSEWDKVLLFNERYWPKDPETRQKYLYTGITRAAKKLVIIK